MPLELTVYNADSTHLRNSRIVTLVAYVNKAKRTCIHFAYTYADIHIHAAVHMPAVIHRDM